MKILVVEDDRKVAGFIEQGLKEEGYVVDVAPDGDEATMLAHVYEYDVILLDVVLPKKNGFQVASELRREGRNTPILMLTSRDAVEDVVRGLDAGADDYLSKPFQFDELLARIRALQRRGGAERLEVLRYGPLALDRLRHVATVNDGRLDLTPKEFQLLEYFLLHPEEVVRRTTLLEKVWDMHFDPESNVVDVHVGNLRRKLMQAAGEPLLATVRGVGFSLRRGAGRGDLAHPLIPRRAALLPAGALSPSSSGWLLRLMGVARRGRRDLVGRAGRHRRSRSCGARCAAWPRGVSRRISWRCSPSSTALFLGQPLAGLIVVLMQTGGEALERYAEGRASRAVRELEAAAPRLAHRVTAAGRRGRRRPTQWRWATSCSSGPASCSPATRVVLEGRSHVDAARLTGEPVPVTAHAGVRLLSGSLNLEGPLTVRATAPAQREPVRPNRRAGADRPGEQVAASALGRPLRGLVHAAHAAGLRRRLPAHPAIRSGCSRCSSWRRPAR